MLNILKYQCEDKQVAMIAMQSDVTIRKLMYLKSTIYGVGIL